ncbi:hypothetical protein NA8A_03425 [Nitratireductor indicus C115]|uniref:EamA domain-containing protein n=1 Tax=Nitratireductor indicus C115 TaxID=1231190 RepID=K2P9H1_9HYPH|nr:hypothetical protein NA8A_03425 [Nitratireductor indicus C115]SFQ16009.1 Permease of the drug/metabolite transporter (DMT) superfamily [Nitratireductor indicus]
MAGQQVFRLPASGLEVPLAVSSNLRGALFLAVSMAGFTCNDAMTKLLTADMNLGQIMFLRGVIATALLALIAWRFGAFANLNLRALAHPMMMLRVIGEIGGNVCFLIAISHTPISSLAAVLQVQPLAVTMGAALFLAEPVGWRRWSAIIVGFIGILIIIRPGAESFNLYSLFGLGVVAFSAMRDIVTRLVPSNIPTHMISMVTAAFVSMAGGALIAPTGGWSPIDGYSLILLILAGSFIVVGYQFIVMALRLGDLSFIAPFRYTSLLWAMMLGFVIFGERPDIAMLVGACIVVCSGLYTLYRERIVDKNRPVAASTAPELAPEEK